MKATWEPGRWWRALDSTGAIWIETSSEREARAALRPGDRLQRLYVRSESQWRDDVPVTIAERDDDGWIVTHPNGDVGRYASKQAVLDAVSSRSAERVMLYGHAFNEIEWR